MNRTESFAVAKQRLSILHRLEAWLEAPMIFLSGVWLCLVVVDLVWGINRFGQRMSTTIWIIFIADFLLRLFLAPRKLRYIQRNWLTAISLLLPALRILRVTRVFRALARLRGLQLLRLLGTINRGMKSLGKTMHRRGFGYVAALTVIVTFAGAAGMYFFEKDVPGGQGLIDFWTALWWTAMIITTMGSDYWPKTPEGRTLSFLLALYAFSVFGYFTGTIATFFIGRDAAANNSDIAGREDINSLKKELALLRQHLLDEKNHRQE